MRDWRPPSAAFEPKFPQTKQLYLTASRPRPRDGAVVGAASPESTKQRPRRAVRPLPRPRGQIAGLAASAALRRMVFIRESGKQGELAASVA